MVFVKLRVCVLYHTKSRYYFFIPALAVDFLETMRALSGAVVLNIALVNVPFAAAIVAMYL